jgi:hypothetical protein
MKQWLARTVGTNIGTEKRRRRALFAIAMLVAAVLAVPAWAATYDAAYDAGLNRTVLFVGDSNITLAAGSVTNQLTTRPNGYLPVLTPRVGMGIRGFASHPAPDYWQIRLGHVLAVVHPDAIVLDLGINDAIQLGTATTTGYASYGEKIDWLVALLPDVPIFWTNLPCSLEPSAVRTGCQAVNHALALAPSRHPNLTILAWAAAANPHPEYMGSPPHLTPLGTAAWAKLITNALDTRFPG